MSKTLPGAYLVYVPVAGSLHFDYPKSQAASFEATNVMKMHALSDLSNVTRIQCSMLVVWPCALMLEGAMIDLL